MGATVRSNSVTNMGPTPSHKSLCDVGQRGQRGTWATFLAPVLPATGHVAELPSVREPLVKQSHTIQDKMVGEKQCVTTDGHTH